MNLLVEDNYKFMPDFSWILYYVSFFFANFNIYPIYSSLCDGLVLEVTLSGAKINQWR